MSGPVSPGTVAAGPATTLAVDDAKVGFTEVRIGVAPAMISVVCLPKMRRADAAELFLSGERMLREVPDLSRAQAFATTEVLSAELFASDEAAEGMAAFREKRPARWVPGA